MNLLQEHLLLKEPPKEIRRNNFKIPSKLRRSYDQLCDATERNEEEEEYITSRRNHHRELMLHEQRHLSMVPYHDRSTAPAPSPYPASAPARRVDSTSVYSTSSTCQWSSGEHRCSVRFILSTATSNLQSHNNLIFMMIG